MGRLTNRLSTTNFRDHAHFDLENPLSLENKKWSIVADGRGGGLRESFERDFSNIFSMDDTNDLGLIVNGNDDDQMIFALDELEQDLDVLANQKPQPSIGGPSTYFDHFGLASSPSGPSSSAWLKTHMLSDPSGLIASTSPSVSWLKTHAPNDPVTVKFTNAGSSLGENSDNTTREGDSAVSASVTRTNRWIGKNDAIVARLSSQAVAARRKADSKAKASVSSTRHKHWTEEEDETLRSAMVQEGSGKIYWNEISRNHFHTTRSASQCKNRWKNVSLV